jgi:hypothetical protein
VALSSPSFNFTQLFAIWLVDCIPTFVSFVAFLSQHFTAVCGRPFTINKAIFFSFPSMPKDCANLASGFESISHDGVIKNCVGAVDGYLLAINIPWKKQAKNVRLYFSGHYRDMVSTFRHVVIVLLIQVLWNWWSRGQQRS